MGLFNFLKPAGKKLNNDTAALANPDFPRPFGYKRCWYVIKNETPQSVIQKMKLDIVRESNWEDGLNATYNEKEMFVSPPLDGNILIINLSPDDEHNSVKEHAALFEEFQFFATHRVVDYHAWAKFVDGKIIRSYSFVGDRGEVTWCEGDITAEEINLGFDKFPSSTGELLLV